MHVHGLLVPAEPFHTAQEMVRSPPAAAVSAAQQDTATGLAAESAPPPGPAGCGGAAGEPGEHGDVAPASGSPTVGAVSDTPELALYRWRTSHCRYPPAMARVHPVPVQVMVFLTWNRWR